MSKYNCSCTNNPSKVSSDNVYYNGAYLSTLNISPNEYLTSILQKINDYSQNTNGCVSCDNGKPVFAGLKNSFALSTDANGKLQTATNVYTKTEVDNLILAGDKNIGNTNLTLTSDRTLNGSDTKNLSITHINNLLLGSNQFLFQNLGSNNFSYQGANGYLYNIRSDNILSIQNYQLPNDSGTIALESYVDEKVNDKKYSISFEANEEGNSITNSNFNNRIITMVVINDSIITKNFTLTINTLTFQNAYFNIGDTIVVFFQ